MTMQKDENIFQAIARESYAGGFYCGWEGDTKDAGDGLFTFIMRELSDEEDVVMSTDFALFRVKQAIEDLESVLEALEDHQRAEARE